VSPVSQEWFDGDFLETVWYIEIYYNRISREHSANNWLTPDEKERKYYELGDVA